MWAARVSAGMFCSSWYSRSTRIRRSPSRRTTKPEGSNCASAWPPARNSREHRLDEFGHREWVDQFDVGELPHVEHASHGERDMRQPHPVCRWREDNVTLGATRRVPMTSRGESAVLVLAAGPGTRMRSDIPKVLHPIAGRSMLSHVLHAIAKVAPQHLVVVLGQQRDSGSRRLVAELADDSRADRSTSRVQDQQLGTGHAVLCGLSALPDDFAGVVVVTSGRHPAAGRRHPGRPDRHPQRRAGRGDRADHHAGRPDRLRPHPAHPGQRGDRDRRAGRRHALAAGDPRGQRRRLRLRHRRAALGAEPAVAPTTPSTSCT